uniref:Uncharacterized protein n=1 Tax=Arundo donax TaxID=35708 RepID=A0A0A8YMU0_ARUDO
MVKILLVGLDREIDTS